MQMCIHTLRVTLECPHPSYISFPYPLCGKHAAVWYGAERGELSVCLRRQSLTTLWFISGTIKKTLQESYFQISNPSSKKIGFDFYIQSDFFP